MNWRCALLRRWLPEYPDGDLPAFWRWRLRVHLAGCPACRRELATLAEVVEAIKSAPRAEPGPAFWEEFSRELHLKLVQAAQQAPAAPEPRRFKLPYLLGAPALALLLVWVGLHVMAPGGGKLAQKPHPVNKEITPVGTPVNPQVAPPLTSAPFLNAVLEEDDGAPPEEDVTGWYMEPVIADLNEQQREVLLDRLRLKGKDGSCVLISSSVSWA